MSSDFDSEISEQARQDTIGKFRRFIDDLYHNLSDLNEKLELNTGTFSCLNVQHSKLIPTTDRGNSMSPARTTVLEHTNFFELLQTCGNSQLNKFILTFASLTEELNELARIGIDRFANRLMLYREEDSLIKTESSLKENEELKQDWNEFRSISMFITFLFDLICYLKRCYEVIGNVVLQKHTMLRYATCNPNDKEFHKSLREILPDLNSNIRFDIVWESMGNLCATLINLDQIFATQSAQIRADLLSYKRLLEMVSKSSQQFKLESKSIEIETLLTLIGEVERELIDGKISGNFTLANGDNGNSGQGQDIDFLFLKGLIVSLLNTNLSENGSLSRNVQLNDNWCGYIKMVCTDLIESKQEPEDQLLNDQRLLGAVSLYSVYFHLFWKDSDRKQLKLLTDSQRKIQLTGFCHLAGNVSIGPDQILVRTLPKQLIDRKSIDYFASQRELLLKVGNTESKVRSQNFALTQWLTTMEQSLNSGFQNDPGDTLQLICSHIELWQQGLALARSLSSLVQNCIAIHFQCHRPLSVTDTVALCKAINQLKGLERFLGKHRKLLLELSTHFQKYNACVVLNILTRTKRKIMTNVQQYSEQKLDLLSALILAANCLNGPVLTEKRLTLTSLCLSYANATPGLFAVDDSAKISIQMKKITFFARLFQTIGPLFDCKFLYFNRAIVGVYFRHFYECQNTGNNSGNGTNLNNRINVNELQYFFAAIDDALPLLESIGDWSKGAIDESISGKKLISIYLDDIYNMFKQQFLNPFCKDFEDELRLRIHSHLQVGDKSPFRRSFRDFQSALSAEPFQLGSGRVICWIKSYVENYLNQLAYNMTAIALHDWKTYESMLGLAHEKFGLQFASLQLPTQTLEQGLDVLEITRNIQIFVSAYLYNLNNQLFVERSSANKHLNVLTIRHVANSIQTHGFGIINSTVNFTYQFLKKQIRTLAQFLFEERIRSKLIKEIRYFREQNSGIQGPQQSESKQNKFKPAKFSFERAEKLAKGIRKLGVTPDGLTYLDKFRQVLTQIGNVLGFVRMIRSGALHCTAEIANFIPDFDDLDLNDRISFEELVRQESDDFGPETIEAAKNFDSILATVAGNFSEETNYFKLLVDVFGANLRDSNKNLHLKNFFVILPATTYNYVEHISICKEKLARKQRQDAAAFTDDGFAMGVVYMLQVLGQFAEFDSLQWFGSVEEHIGRSIEQARLSTVRQSPRSMINLSLVESLAGTSASAASGGATNDDQLLQTTALTIKRLEILQREFQLLSFGITSCRILFRS